MDHLARSERREAVFERIKRALADILGAGAAEIASVGERCELFRGLQMGSIQSVALAERLNAAHGGWAGQMARLSRKPARALARLAAGKIAGFIADANQLAKHRGSESQ
jgi:hypothetical protein